MLENYKYKGARALVLLHEDRMKSFLQIWKIAKQKNISLPQTDDPDYKSLETLLQHVLRSSGGYMKWICKNLDLDDLDIQKIPEEQNVDSESEKYLIHLLETWKLPLADVNVEQFSKVFKSNWDVDFSIESMLEHAVLHPMRHEFQLKELMDKDS